MRAIANFPVLMLLLSLLLVAGIFKISMAQNVNQLLSEIKTLNKDLMVKKDRLKKLQLEYLLATDPNRLKGKEIVFHLQEPTKIITLAPPEKKKLEQPDKLAQIHP